MVCPYHYSNHIEHIWPMVNDFVVFLKSLMHCWCSRWYIAIYVHTTYNTPYITCMNNSNKMKCIDCIPTSSRQTKKYTRSHIHNAQSHTCTMQSHVHQQSTIYTWHIFCPCRTCHLTTLCVFDVWYVCVYIVWCPGVRVECTPSPRLKTWRTDNGFSSIPYTPSSMCCTCVLLDEFEHSHTWWMLSAQLVVRLLLLFAKRCRIPTTTSVFEESMMFWSARRGGRLTNAA